MRIALVAHNGKKDDMVALATEFASQLRGSKEKPNA